MDSIVHEVKNFVLHVDHGDNILGLNWDDIVANPVAARPKVLSPHKVGVDKSKVGEKRSGSEEHAEGGTYSGTEQSDSRGESDFMDSEYEVDVEDDDFFSDNGREEVIDVCRSG